ncbi:hypothetical protein PSEUDO8O_120086 [Pseudomonas sp. 8O]|nr:hypothetical protein PSEUDO8O_120086 [Pseudomonas sp. 8O]
MLSTLKEELKRRVTYQSLRRSGAFYEVNQPVGRLAAGHILACSWLFGGVSRRLPGSLSCPPPPFSTACSAPSACAR